MIRRLALLLAALLAAAPAVAATPRRTEVCAACLKATVEHLAAPALNGRRCATADEAAAAHWLAARMQAAGLRGGFPGGRYLEPVTLTRPALAAPPVLTAGGVTLRHGEEMIVTRSPRGLSGPLMIVRGTTPASLPAGGVVLVAPGGARVSAAQTKDAAAVLSVATKEALSDWSGMRDTWLRRVDAAGPTQLILRPEAAARLAALPEGTPVRLDARLGAPELRTTHNVLGVIHGRAADADRRAVLLSAHYDGLGLRRGELHPGANDDATGTATVLEMARVIRAGRTPARTVWFALWGCEEEGGLGARAFLGRPAFALTDLSTNLEFEMVGERDPKTPDRLMMTGWERSDLGPHLAAEGAKVGPDLYPEQNFFTRSDNYALAEKGVVAHTISAWPVPPTYHRPTDDAAHVDFAFMAEAVRSLAKPVRDLVDGSFVPSWAPGGRP